MIRTIPYKTRRWQIADRWLEPLNQHTKVLKAMGMAVIIWPSGRWTLELYSGAVTMNQYEASVADPEVVIRQKVQVLDQSMQEYMSRQNHGWFIRVRKGRKKARRYAHAEFIHPQHYTPGVPPWKGGLIPEDLEWN